MIRRAPAATRPAPPTGRAPRANPSIPVGPQHRAEDGWGVARDPPRVYADGRRHAADAAVPQADLHAAGMRRLRDEVNAIIEGRDHLEREGRVQGIRTRDAPVIRAVPL